MVTRPLGSRGVPAVFPPGTVLLARNGVLRLRARARIALPGGYARCNGSEDMGTLVEDLAHVLSREARTASDRGVELAQTHISWVLLSDDDVIKVKKPVRFSFLDFSTASRRRAACEAEVRLNARLAPDVYRGVIPVRVSGGRHVLGGDQGEIVDWAVRMRRLPDAHRADVLLARRELDHARIDLVANRMAEFHATSASDASAAAFGTRDAIAGCVEENFIQMRGAIERYIAPAEAEEIERWQRAFVETRHELFARRVEAGRVRDGHGDLRLEHVYFEPDGIRIIDCIEFNDRFRFADVCSDVAFLSMDLALHGAVDLAERLLARYARDANDFDLYALVDFYESYRAYVRGKVAHLVASDETTGAELRARAAAHARRCFLLALSGDRRPLLSPAVVAVGGVIASGKSTIADAVAGELGAPVVCADRTRKHMLGVRPTEPVHTGTWTGAYDPSFTESVYREVLRRAEVVLASGRPVVLDASFRSVALRRAARDLAQRYDVPFRFFECTVPREVARARLAQRAKSESVSDGRLEVFDDFCARFEPVGELAEPEHVVLDSTQPLEDTLACARGHVATWPRGLVA
jgi:aminoglycoside phosphotransferase family enzyme/predicted kinase